MSLLKYTSKEMFSSTELIRKSKSIYEKLNSKEIEKAIILRDGKPSFMLLDFETYEIIMDEYLRMKGTSNLIEKKEKRKKLIKAEKIPKVTLIKEKEDINSPKIIEIKQINDFKEETIIENKEEILTNNEDIEKTKEIRRKSLASNQDALKEVLSNMGKDNESTEEEKNGTIRQKLKEFWD